MKRYPKLPDHFLRWFKSHDYTRNFNSWTHPCLSGVRCSYSHEDIKWCFTVCAHGYEYSAEHPETATRGAYALCIEATESPSHKAFFQSALDQLDKEPLNVSWQQLYAWMHTTDEKRIQHGIDTVNDPVKRAFLCDHLRRVQLAKSGGKARW